LYSKGVVWKRSGRGGEGLAHVEGFLGAQGAVGQARDLVGQRDDRAVVASACKQGFEASAQEWKNKRGLPLFERAPL
jgi:hypothetical protein